MPKGENKECNFYSLSDIKKLKAYKDLDSTAIGKAKSHMSRIELCEILGLPHGPLQEGRSKYVARKVKSQSAERAEKKKRLARNEAARKRRAALKRKATKKRKTTKRKTTKRKTTKRKTTKRKSTKRKSTKRKTNKRSAKK